MVLNPIQVCPLCAFPLLYLLSPCSTLDHCRLALQYLKSLLLLLNSHLKHRTHTTETPELSISLSEFVTDGLKNKHGDKEGNIKQHTT